MHIHNPPLLDALHLLRAYRALGSELPGEKFTPRTDEAIVDAVREALHRNPRVHGSETLVQALEGVVTLAGTVSNLRARQEAERDTRDVADVHEVHNLLKVRPAYASHAADSCPPTLPAVAYEQNPAEANAPAPQAPETFAPLADAHR
jgi:hypothetical protein